MITGTIIVLLVAALLGFAVALLIVRGERDAFAFELEMAKQSAAHHKEMEEAEEARADGLLEQNVRIAERLKELEEQKHALEHTLASQRAMHAAALARVTPSPRAARFKLEGGLSEELIAETLAGTAGTPILRAVLAYVTRKIIGSTDAATDRPRVELRLPDRTIAGYTAEDRLYDSGAAGAFAELLRELQELAAVKEEKSAA